MSRNLLFILLTVILFFFLQIFINRYQVNATEKYGNEIISALNQYYEKNRKYPNTMDEMVPEFIDRVPKSKMGLWKENFYYSNRQNEGFELSFDVDGFIRHYNTGSRWYSND